MFQVRVWVFVVVGSCTHYISYLYIISIYYFYILYLYIWFGKYLLYNMLFTWLCYCMRNICAHYNFFIYLRSPMVSQIIYCANRYRIFDTNSRIFHFSVLFNWMVSESIYWFPQSSSRNAYFCTSSQETSAPLVSNIMINNLIWELGHVAVFIIWLYVILSC